MNKLIQKIDKELSSEDNDINKLLDSLSKKEIETLLKDNRKYVSQSGIFRQFIHKLSTLKGESDFFDNYILENYGSYPEELNFNQADKDPLANMDIVDSIFTTTFKVKWNQILKVINLGYIYEIDSLILNDPPELKSFAPLEIQSFLETNKCEGDNIDSRIINLDSEIIDGGYKNAFNIFKSRYEKMTKLSSLLAKLDRVYLHEDKDSLLIVKYICKADSLNITKDQIKYLVSQIYAVDQEFQTCFSLPISKAIIISMNPMHPRSIVTLQNMSFFTEGSTKMIHNINFNIMYHTQLLINVTKSFLVPKHEKLNKEEVSNLLEKTNWKIDNLQGISYKDPVVLYHGYQIDDVIRITRTREMNTQLMKYSYAYRVVRNIPMYYSNDKSKSERIINDVKT